MGWKLWHKKTDIQRYILSKMELAGTQAFLVCLLFLSLFLTDAWILGNQPNSNDDALEGVLIAIFILFCTECLVLSFCQPFYITTIFFYLDVLGTISIIIDIPSIAGQIGIPQDGVSSNGAVLRSTRAAKLGSRYGRLMRILKLTGFLRHLPCFKQPEEKEPVMSQVRRVTTVLIAKISQNVAAVVMILVIVVPFLSYTPMEASPNAWVQNLKLAVKQNTTNLAQLNTQIHKMRNFYLSSQQMPKLMRVAISSPYLQTQPQPYTWEFHTRNNVRTQNTLLFMSNFKTASMSQNYVSVTLDMTAANQQDSMLSTILIVMVIVLLCAISTSLQVNVDKMVVEPLERMTTKLTTLAQDVLKSFQASVKDDAKGAGEDNDDENLEDLLLEKMVEKISKIIDLKSEKHHEIEMVGTENLDENTRRMLRTYSKPDTPAPANNYTVELIANDVAEEMRLQKLLSNFSTIDIESLDSWAFDVLEHTHEELFEIFGYIYGRLDAFNAFSVSRPVFMAFMLELSVRYVNTNTYHNFRHGCDVAFTVWRLITVPSLDVALNHLEMFSIMTAALAHDVGHPGVNNVYLVKAGHPLAINHNDRSPLENFHCVELYSILSKAETNIFANLTDTQYRDARKIILHAILGTDMTHHFKQITETNLFAELHTENIHEFCVGNVSTIDCLGEEKNRLFLIEMCLHCADISNPYKSWTCCEKWADLVIEEFCAQGDREKREGLEVTPMCDRATMNKVNSQLGFIEFVVAPLIIAFVKMFPPLYEVGENVSENFSNWCDLRKADIQADLAMADKEGELAKIDVRAKAFQEKFSFTEGLKAKMMPALTVDTPVR